MPPKEPCPDMAGTLIARPRPNGEAVSGHRPAKIPNWRKSTSLSRVVLLGERLLPRRHPSPRSACRPGRGLNSLAPPRAKPRRLDHERGRRFSWWGRSRPTTISCLMHVGGSFRPPPPMPNLQFRPCARRADNRGLCQAEDPEIQTAPAKTPSQFPATLAGYYPWFSSLAGPPTTTPRGLLFRPRAHAATRGLGGAGRS